MLQAMQAGGGPGGGAFPSPFGDVPGGGGGGDDPFAAMLNSLTAGGPGGGLPPGFGQQQQQQPDFAYSGEKTKRDKVFDLAHVLGVVGLVSFVLRWWEPMALAKRKMAGYVEQAEGSSGLTASPIELVRPVAQAGKGRKRGILTDTFLSVRPLRFSPSSGRS